MHANNDLLEIIVIIIVKSLFSPILPCNSITKVSFTIALVFAYNPAEEHCMLIVAALCLVVFRYRAILHKEDDIFTSVQQWLWWWATLLSIQYPERGAGSLASSETHDQSECFSADAATGSSSEENTLRKRTAKKLE